VVVAVDDRRNGLPIQELLDCKLRGTAVTDALSFFERETGRVNVDHLYPSWMIFSDGFIRNRIQALTQRGFDLIASTALLLITWPVMLVTAALIWIEDRGRHPILYRQTRVGYEGRAFEVLKFRSMRPDAEKDGRAVWAKEDDDRVTRVGAFIRKYRIDELPQIFNVLRGDMSFVGPRPERPTFVAELSQKIPYYRERHSVKPGITGWAQLCYRYGSTDEDALQKLQYDLYYVKNRSFLFDLMILLQTAEVVLWRQGAR
jgi:sugar transferase (PEP-CTERM system associated)